MEEKIRARLERIAAIMLFHWDNCRIGRPASSIPIDWAQHLPVSPPTEAIIAGGVWGPSWCYLDSGLKLSEHTELQLLEGYSDLLARSGCDEEADQLTSYAKFRRNPSFLECPTKNPFYKSVKRYILSKFYDKPSKPSSARFNSLRRAARDLPGLIRDVKEADTVRANPGALEVLLSDLNELLAEDAPSAAVIDGLWLRTQLVLHDLGEAPDRDYSSFAEDLVRTLDTLPGTGRDVDWGSPEAEPLLRERTLAFEKALGPEHPMVATHLDRLASLHANQARYDEAESEYKRALSILTASEVAKPSALIEVLRHYALLLRTLGRNREADEQTARARAVDAGSLQQ